MKNFLAIFFIIVLASGLYALTLRGVHGNPKAETIKATLEEAPKPFELSPERGRFAHVLSLSENNSYALSKTLGEFVYPDVGWSEGKFYSFFAPGISYMVLPFYELGKNYELSQLFTFAFISLVSILALIFLFKIAREILKLPIWASILAVVIFAFGSTAWSYAVTLYQHHVTVFFMLSAVYCIWRYKQRTRFSWVWAIWPWVAYALAISIDYPNAILLLPVMVYFLIVAIDVHKLNEKLTVKLRNGFLITSLAFVLLAGIQLNFNNKEFGGYTKLAGGITGYKTIVESKWQDYSVSEINQKLKERGGQKNVVKFFSEQKIPSSFGTLWFSKDRGLLFYSPIFLLAIFGLLSLLRKMDLEKGVLLSLVVVNVFLYSSWGDPWGGWAYGPRYLIPSMSILSLFVASWLVSGSWVWVRRLFALVLFAYSSAIAILGVLTTNAVPPRIEADQMHTTYNYLRNILMLQAGQSGSFAYNTIFRDSTSLLNYAIAIYGVVLVVFIVLVFIGPISKKHES